ncbi:MAG: hypothetical protein EOO67_15065, partial [Microbacterium sp.]
GGVVPGLVLGVDLVGELLGDRVQSRRVRRQGGVEQVGDPADLAASGIPGGGLDASNATAMAGSTGVETSYQRLINGFGTEVASVTRLAANQYVLTSQVDGSREQLSGVNLDEETVSMLAAQHAYEAASRVMTTLDSVLDTLINRTGVTR